MYNKLTNLFRFLKFNLSSNAVFVFSYDVSHPAPSASYSLIELKKKNESIKDVTSFEPSVVGVNLIY